MKKTNETVVTAEPGSFAIVIERDFEAPRELVFRAFTEPAVVKQWNTFDRFDCQKGGEYRFLLSGPGGKPVGFGGVFHEVLAPRRLIRTYEYEGRPIDGQVGIEIIRFETRPGGRTRVNRRMVCPSVEYRDGMVGAGMRPALKNVFIRLDELLATLQKNPRPASRAPHLARRKKS